MLELFPNALLRHHCCAAGSADLEEEGTEQIKAMTQIRVTPEATTQIRVQLFVLKHPEGGHPSKII